MADFKTADDYRSAWLAENAAAQALLRCPHCKVPAGVACAWAATWTTGSVHTARLKAWRKAIQKLSAK